MSDGLYKLAKHTYVCDIPQCFSGRVAFSEHTSFSEHIVLLHGWGTQSHSWAPLIPALQKIGHVTALDLPGFGESDSIPDFTLDLVLPLIAKHLPEKCVLIGWSLGGVLAVQLAARYPQKITRLVTLATNVKFVASENYLTAMAPEINKDFNQSFTKNAQATLKVFSGLLAQGDLNERVLLKNIRSLIDIKSVSANWSQALTLLAETDNRKVFSKLTQKGLHLLAEKDALIPSNACKPMSELASGQEVKVIPDAAHALHWSKPELVSDLITKFLLNPSPSPVNSLDKKLVADSFSRAANTYDSVANLQRYVGELLLESVDKNSTVKVVLDLGCGTGYFTPKLQNMFSDAVVVGVDIAEGMLRVASELHLDQKNWLCADADFLPLATNSIDLIYSNFALQWCTDLTHLFKEIKRILKTDGQFIFTSLGPATLHELKSAWASVDAHVHVNQFQKSQQLIDCLKKTELEITYFNNKIEVMRFENLSDLTRSLKCLGAHNINPGRASGLTGRQKIQAFKQAYEGFRNNNSLPATYDIFYVKVKNNG